MRRYITLSIDDGHPTDLKTAELLKKYGLKATFYVPATNPEREVMSAEQVRALSRDFEIGTHTLSHLSLTRMSREKVRTEIVDGKKWVEDVTGKSSISFCYPQGKFNRAVVDQVRDAGFVGARTCFLNVLDFPNNPFLWGASTQAFSHSPAIQIRHALVDANFTGLLNYGLIYRFERNWVTHFTKALSRVGSTGGVAHLYFHSWEIEQQGSWDDLERVFADIARLKDFERVTNGELFTRGRDNDLA